MAAPDAGRWVERAPSLHPAVPGQHMPVRMGAGGASPDSRTGPARPFAHAPNCPAPLCTHRARCLPNCGTLTPALLLPCVHDNRRWRRWRSTCLPSCWRGRRRSGASRARSPRSASRTGGRAGSLGWEGLGGAGLGPASCRAARARQLKPWLPLHKPRAAAPAPSGPSRAPAPVPHVCAPAPPCAALRCAPAATWRR